MLGRLGISTLLGLNLFAKFIACIKGCIRSGLRLGELMARVVVVVGSLVAESPRALFNLVDILRSFSNSGSNNLMRNLLLSS